jgi:hypothetical protein
MVLPSIPGEPVEICVMVMGKFADSQRLFWEVGWADSGRITGNKNESSVRAQCGLGASLRLAFSGWTYTYYRALGQRFPQCLQGWVDRVDWMSRTTTVTCGSVTTGFNFSVKRFYTRKGALLAPTLPEAGSDFTNQQTD